MWEEMPVAMSLLRPTDVPSSSPMREGLTILEEILDLLGYRLTGILIEPIRWRPLMLNSGDGTPSSGTS